MSELTIISGKKQSGKTTYLAQLVQKLNAEKKVCDGFIAVGKFEKNQRHSFKLVDITTFEEINLMSIVPNKKYQLFRKFYINPLAIEFGEKILRRALKSDCEIIIIDEIGPLEIENGGWTKYFKRLLDSEKKIIITVREELIEAVVSHFAITDYKLISI